MFTKFKKLCCKWKIHSFRLRIVDNGFDMPKTICMWCGKDEIAQFGIPPKEFLEVSEKLNHLREEMKAKK